MLFCPVKYLVGQQISISAIRCLGWTLDRIILLLPSTLGTTRLNSPSPLLQSIKLTPADVIDLWWTILMLPFIWTLQVDDNFEVFIIQMSFKMGKYDLLIQLSDIRPRAVNIISSGQHRCSFDRLHFSGLVRRQIRCNKSGHRINLYHITTNEHCPRSMERFKWTSHY